MTSRPRFTFHLPLPAFALATLGLLIMIATAPGLAQTFTVLHTFTDGADGADPFAGVTVGGTGTLYGTTYAGGGSPRYGVVFELAQRGPGWTLSPLYEFHGSDGLGPEAPVTVGPNGALYGTTTFGGNGNGTGTVFELRPPATVCPTPICYWSETVLHSFNGYDGALPDDVQLVFDQAGNIYGTTVVGGAYGDGTVFELTPSGEGWTESVLHNFNDNRIDGYEPYFGVISDRAGNLYGTTDLGGTAGNAGGGTVFELSPSGATWTESILYDFPLDNLGGTSNPGALIMDRFGNLYGTTSDAGENDGSLFELTPSDGGWIFSTLYSFVNSCYPAGLVMDTAGNFYGNCDTGGRHGEGMVFKLTNSGGSWTLTDLHDFTNGNDGGIPSGGVALDASGNLYGTTQGGGTYGDGVVWEISGLADRH